MRKITVGSAALNQTPMDWDANVLNLIGTLESARKAQVQILCLPELCISGYGCEDMFLSGDLRERCLDKLFKLIPETKGLVCNFGLPLELKGQVYNTAALVANGELLGFAAKHYLAREGVYYEPRWFTPWPIGQLERINIEGREYPVGDLIFDINHIRIAFEICEDAWVKNRFGEELSKLGVDVFLNPSASHFAFGKEKIREELVVSGSRDFSSVYIYANLLGNDAGRLVYDGSRIIAERGKLLCRGELLTYKNSELSLATASVPDGEIRAKGSNIIHCQFKLKDHSTLAQITAIEPYLSKEEELFRVVSLGLFDYMRKSRQKGFIISLSGGVDSSATALLAVSSFKVAVQELGLKEVQNRLGYWKEIQGSLTTEELVKAGVTCIYQATENSGEVTKAAAKKVANTLGASYIELDISELVSGYLRLLKQTTDLPQELTWKEHDRPLQNIQARVRGPGIWLIANLKEALLLATSNRSEASVGYTTMDGDTCGGLSPLSGVDKAYLRNWLRWMEEKGVENCPAIPELKLVNDQEPTAELRPAGSRQTDEGDLMPYVVLDAIERLAIRDRISPREVLHKIEKRFAEYTKNELTLWVKRFFRLWSQNQWKRERYAPSFHLDDESVDPKGWCRFPILSGGYVEELKEL